MAAKNLMEVVVEEGVHMEPQNHPMEEMEAMEVVYLVACLILVKS